MAVSPPTSYPSPTIGSQPSCSGPNTRLSAARPIARSSSMTRVYPGSTRPSPVLVSSTMCATRAASTVRSSTAGGCSPAATTRLQTGDELRFADLRFRFVSGPAGQSHTPLTTKSAPPLPSLDRADLVSHPDRLRFDDVAAEVYVGAGRVALAPKEYALLRVLWRRAGQVCSKECLAQAVWPEYQGIVSDASIESTVSRLRRKLAAAGGRRAWVQTVPRQGYRLIGDEK